MSEPASYDWQNVSGETVDGITRKEIGGDGAALKLVVIPAGTHAPSHDHPFEQFVQVISGSGTLECGAGEVPLRPGTVVHLPPGAWHSAAFDEETVLVEVNLPTSEA